MPHHPTHKTTYTARNRLTQRICLFVLDTNNETVASTISSFTCLAVRIQVEARSRLGESVAYIHRYYCALPSPYGIYCCQFDYFKLKAALRQSQRPGGLPGACGTSADSSKAIVPSYRIVRDSGLHGGTLNLHSSVCKLYLESSRAPNHRNPRTRFPRGRVRAIRPRVAGLYRTAEESFGLVGEVSVQIDPLLHVAACSAMDSGRRGHSPGMFSGRQCLLCRRHSICTLAHPRHTGLPHLMHTFSRHFR
jgi:hypothetical protein